MGGVVGTIDEEVFACCGSLGSDVSGSSVGISSAVGLALVDVVLSVAVVASVSVGSTRIGVCGDTRAVASGRIVDSLSPFSWVLFDASSTDVPI